jgi:hypothetical protein
MDGTLYIELVYTRDTDSVVNYKTKYSGNK